MSVLLPCTLLNYLTCRLITSFITNGSQFVAAVPLKNQLERISQYVSEPHEDTHTKSGHQTGYCNDFFWFNKTSQLGFIHPHLA